MAEVNLKPFKCDNGTTYSIPENHCVFCEHCTDIFYDYTNGPYLFFCDIGSGDFNTCNSFKESEG